MIAGAIAALATWLARSGARLYPLPELFVALALGVALAWLKDGCIRQRNASGSQQDGDLQNSPPSGQTHYASHKREHKQISVWEV